MARHVPCCPRCGYDLSGEVQRWSRECPLEGRCSECGLDFVWADVVSDRLRPPPWSFEHALGRWPLRLPRAWAVSLRPSRCWSILRLEHRVHARRLLLTLLLLIAGAWTFLGLASALAVAAQERFAIQRSVARGWAPTSSAPPGLIELAWEEHKDVLFLPIVAVERMPLMVWRGPLIGAWMVALVSSVAAMPLAFLLLPATFQRTQVRRAHLLRAAVYTLPAPMLLLFLGVLVIAATGELRLLAYAWAFTAAGAVYLVLAWRRITRDYLRLPHHRAVWLAMSTISILTGAVAGALLVPGELYAYLWAW